MSNVVDNKNWPGQEHGHDPEGLVLDAAVESDVDITEDRQTEARGAGQRRFQAIFDNSLDPFLLADDEGRYIDANPSACRLLGYSKEELLRRRIWDITPDSSAEEGRRMWQAFLAQGELKGEYTVLRKDKTTRVVEFKAVSRIQPGVHLSVLHDITERKRLWEENQQQRLLLERIVNEAPAAICLLEGPEHRYTFVNAAYRQIARGKGELKGRTVAEVWPEAAEVVVPLLDEVFQSGNSYHSSDLPVPMLRNQGPEIAYITFSFTPLQSAGGRVQGVLVVAVETTERKHAESVLVGQLQILELLARSAEFTEILEALARIVEQQAPDAVASILLLDEEGKLRHGAAPSLPDSYNRAVDGLAADPDVGTCAAAAARGEVVITPDIASDPQWQGLSHLPLKIGLKAAWSVPILTADGKVLGTLGTYFREPRTPRKHERRTVELLASTAAMAIEHKQGEIERRELLAALDRERARLEQLTETLEQRVWLQTRQIRRLATELALVEQRERLRIAQVLHDDAQQMLTALQLNLHMIRTSAETETGEKLRELEASIDDIVDTLRNLAVELRTPALSSENMEDVFTWLATHMEERHGLEVNLTVEGPCRVPDEERRELIVRLVRELLFNVVKHAGVDQVQLRLKEQGKQLVATIEDDGVGFDVARMMKQRAQGKGFGLYSVRERARLFDGSLDIESAPGKGTRATLTIPRSAADANPIL